MTSFINNNCGLTTDALPSFLQRRKPKTMKFQLLFSLMLISTICFAQLPVIDQVNEMYEIVGGDGYIHDYAGDDQGNVFIAGNFNQEVDFYGDIHTSANSCVWLAKSDSVGNKIWTYGFDTDDMQLGKIEVGPNGNLFVGGMFNGTLTIDGTSITALTYSDLFVAELNPVDLSLVNLKHLESSYNSNQDHNITSIAFDNAGNTYVGMYFTDNMSCETDTLVALGLGDMGLVKLDSNFDTEWFKRMGGTWPSPCGAGEQNDYISDIEVDGSGNVFITGWYAYNCDFGESVTLASDVDDHVDAFVAKIDANGLTQWASNLGGKDWTKGRQIELDSEGNIYAAGDFEDYLFVTTDSIFDHPQGHGWMFSYDSYLVKLDPLGNDIWMKSWGAAQQDLVLDLLVDPSDNAYVVTKINLDAVVGDTTYNYNQTSVGDTRFIIQEVDPAGIFTKANMIGGRYTNFKGMHFDVDYNIIFCFSSTNYFDFNVGDTTILGVGSANKNMNYLCRREASSNLLLGLDENHIQTQVNCYPNPATHTINVLSDFKNPTHITLTDLRGRILIEKRGLKAGLNSSMIDISGLRNGLYLITVYSDLEKRTTRFVKH